MCTAPQLSPPSDAKRTERRAIPALKYGACALNLLVTVDNVDLQLQHVDFALVASSVSLNNTDLNPSAVAELAARFAARRSSR